MTVTPPGRPLLARGGREPVTSRSAVPREARPVRVACRRLTAAAAGAPCFVPEPVTGLAELARRWLGHAIPPGTPLWHAAVLPVRGEIPRALAAVYGAQVLAPPPRGASGQPLPGSQGCRGPPMTGCARGPSRGAGGYGDDPRRDRCGTGCLHRPKVWLITPG